MFGKFVDGLKSKVKIKFLKSKVETFKVAAQVALLVDEDRWEAFRLGFCSTNRAPNPAERLCDEYARIWSWRWRLRYKYNVNRFRQKEQELVECWISWLNCFILEQRQRWESYKLRCLSWFCGLSDREPMVGRLPMVRQARLWWSEDEYDCLAGAVYVGFTLFSAGHEWRISLVLHLDGM